MFPRLVLPFVAALLLVTAVLGQTTAADENEIRNVLETAYVQGVFVDRNETLVRDGFHADFVMPIVLDGRLMVAPLDMWLERLQLDGQPSADTIRAEFVRIDVTGQAATAQMEIWINDEHTYTDYFSLYKLDGAWKIVTKIFASHG